MDDGAEAKGKTMEWARLRVVGEPLLCGASLGATPLLWVACRATPCLVHIFCDAQLLIILRFPADPVFLSIGSIFERSVQPTHSIGCLLVITQDGSIWITKLPTTTSTKRSFQKQRSANLGVIQRVKSSVVKDNSSRSYIRVSEHGQSQPSFVSQELPSLGATCVVNNTTLWKELAVETDTSSPRSVEVKNVDVAETLIGIVPGATAAAFSRNNSVAIVASYGPTELFRIERLSPSLQVIHQQDPHLPPSGFLSRIEPTCLLFASSVQHAQKNGSTAGHATLSDNLLRSLFSWRVNETQEASILLQGNMDGKVYASHVQNDTLVTCSQQIICDIQQPIVAIFPIVYLSKLNKRITQTSTTTEKLDTRTAANWLVVLGQLGRVSLISSAIEQTKTEDISSPFRMYPLNLSGSGDRSHSSCNVKDLVVSDCKINGPVRSACLLHPDLICYTVGSDVFVTRIVENPMSTLETIGVGSGVKKLKRTVDPANFSIKSGQVGLLSRQFNISNVAAITGSGLFVYGGSRPLVVLKRSGSLQSIKVSEEYSSPLRVGESGFSSCEDSFVGCSEKKVKVLLQSISDAESCREAIQSHEKALTYAMNELALALSRINEITYVSSTFDPPNNLHNRKLQTALNTVPTNPGLNCTLTATLIPVISVENDQLSFGGPEFGVIKEPLSGVDVVGCTSYETRLDVRLINQCRNPLSQYWSLVVQLQSCLSSTFPSSFYSLLINANLGLPIGSIWNHSLNVRLPGGPWGPLIATIYLCHIHDYHRAVLVKSQGIDAQRSWRVTGTVPSAACVVLLRQRVDIISLLQSPPSRLGYTSWTPSSSEKISIQNNPAFVADTGKVDNQDLGDADLMRSFSGSLAWSSYLSAEPFVDGSKRCGTVDGENSPLNVLQQAMVSKVLDWLRLASQGEDAVLTSYGGRAGDGTPYSVINFRTPSLLFGILVREALLWHLVLSETKAPGDTSKAEMLDRGKRARISERVDQVESLARRARSVMHLLKKCQRPNAPTTADLVVPLLSHTYALTQEVIHTYKTHRGNSSSSF